MRHASPSRLRRALSSPIVRLCGRLIVAVPAAALGIFALLAGAIACWDYLIDLTTTVTFQALAGAGASAVVVVIAVDLLGWAIVWGISGRRTLGRRVTTA